MSSDSHVPFVVHRYVSNEHIITQTVAQAFLKQGARILQQHQNRPKWHNVCLQPPLPAAESLPPPPPPPQVVVSSSQLKDWPGLPDEIYNLDDLDEFQCWHSSTDPLPYSEPPIPSACSQSQSDPHPSLNQQNVPSRKGRLQQPVAARYPQPHILVSKTMTKPDFLATNCILGMSQSSYLLKPGSMIATDSPAEPGSSPFGGPFPPSGQSWALVQL
ncbi:hypothetical protein D9757_015229 [Collybiopsis confluens]|uniref:Uncharacterized protein n=1 Tax=Collybiopsis confluens TaxID=2823264 RepID=A0A8H5C0Q4_9AGAR|nr:hypothetical protein D9757_015229 [Collybiopsis confluens]